MEELFALVDAGFPDAERRRRAPGRHRRLAVLGAGRGPDRPGGPAGRPGGLRAGEPGRRRRRHRVGPHRRGDRRARAVDRRTRGASRRGVPRAGRPAVVRADRPGVRRRRADRRLRVGAGHGPPDRRGGERGRRRPRRDRAAEQRDRHPRARHRPRADDRARRRDRLRALRRHPLPRGPPRGTVAAGRDPRRHGLGGPGRGVRRHDRRDLDARPPARRHRMGRRRGRRGVGNGARHHARLDDPPARAPRSGAGAGRSDALARTPRRRLRRRRPAGGGVGVRATRRCRRRAGCVHARRELGGAPAAPPGAAALARTRTADLALSLEPDDPAAPVAMGGRRVRCAARDRLPGDEHAPRVARRGQLPRGHLHAAGLRPDGRGLRGGLQRTVPDHRRARPLGVRLGRRATRPARWRTCSGRWPGPRAWPR